MKRIFVIMAILMVSSFVYATFYVGAKSESFWENDWLGRFRGDDVCGEWYNRMGDNSNVVKNSWNGLNGNAKIRYEDTGDHHLTFGLDGQDIFLHCGHTGYNANHARYPMWAENEWVQTRDNVRLGDEARELKLWSTYGCNQLTDVDGNRNHRWRLVFRGGLKMKTGFHGLAWLNSSSTTKNKDVGKDYANYLNTTNKTIRYAWWDAVKSFSDNKPAVLVTGTNASNAGSRRDNMRMVDLPNYTVLRDGAIGGWASTTWR